MFKHILVPTDGSDLSALAVAQAAKFAQEIGARLTFLYATPKHKGYFFGEGALDAQIPPEAFAATMAHIGDQALTYAGDCARAAGVAFALIAEPADAPYEAIVATAQKLRCDVIFMASHGRRGVSGLILGSETMKVLTHSKIPVLVYR